MYLSLYNGNDVLKGGSTDFPDQDSDNNYNYDSDVSLRWGISWLLPVGLMCLITVCLVKCQEFFTRYHSRLREYRTRCGRKRRR